MSKKDVKDLVDGAHRVGPNTTSGFDAEAIEQSAAPATAANSDDALALEFVRQYGSHFRWTPGFDWMHDNGRVWQRDTCRKRVSAARRVGRAAANGADVKPPEAKRLASAAAAHAMLTFAATDPRIVLPPSVWDAAPLLLNTPDGLVDLTTGLLRPRDGAYVTQSTEVTPLNTPTPIWDKFIKEVFEDDAQIIDFMRRSLGYCLTGDRREQVLFFWYGVGSNGKSVLADLINWLLGTYAMKLPASTLMVSRSDRHPTEIAQLRGARLAISSELEDGSFFNEALVKELTGDETARARFMKQDFFEFKLEQKHLVIGNYRPRLRGGDQALARRMILVPFKAKFEREKIDKQMLGKLKAEGPGILHWLIGGTMAWLTSGLGIPESILLASREYLAEHDDIALWMAECCLPKGEAKSTNLYTSYKVWKEARGEHAQSMTQWGTRLSQIAGITKGKSNGVVYRGICLARLRPSEF